MANTMDKLREEAQGDAGAVDALRAKLNEAISAWGEHGRRMWTDEKGVAHLKVGPNHYAEHELRAEMHAALDALAASVAPKADAGSVDAKTWLLDVMGTWDFTMPTRAFDEIVNRIAASATPRTEPATLPEPQHVYLTDKGAVIDGVPQRGWPEESDAAHNCDAMGCGQMHVLYRLPFTDERTEAQCKASPDGKHSEHEAQGTAGWCEWCSEQIGPRTEPAEGREAMRDAERYRLLRKGAVEDVAVVRGLGAMDYGMGAVVSTYSEEIDGDDLDAAIDAARQQENGDERG